MGIVALSAIANSDNQEAKKALTAMIVGFIFSTGIIIAMLILDVSILSLLTIYFYSFPGVYHQISFQIGTTYRCQ